jgi:hypothetical protein
LQEILQHGEVSISAEVESFCLSCMLAERLDSLLRIKILGLKMDVAIKIFAVEWVRLFKIRPYLTSALTVFILAIAVVGTTYLNKLDQEKREKGRLENQSYQQQINQLKQTETNIRQLLEFVNIQKRTLREAEDTISVLKSEKEKLKPIVDSDRAVVEALFRVQEERTVENI